ncbi:hypothetical protein FGG08_003370 [Glutinoglossum americanum]|uniref:histidine kinase n=1 Tax=Glutinoglossum americanum TaxID=1670608 RepID=A0A9P8I7H6_9PEZI|nr:hypothetical protein FGG08_003370 [Glutinoglossum americanum]
MSTGRPVHIEDLPSSISRLSLCLTHHESKVILHDGEDGFREELRRHFSVPEIKAGKGVFELKTRLRMSSTDDFWQVLVEGMTDVAGAQIAFVSKRAPEDGEDCVSDKLQFGATGALYTALVYYYNDGYGISNSIRNMKYEAAFGTACDYMRHNKVLFIPERFGEAITATDLRLPFPVEASLAVPLFSEGQCFGHFGIMWSHEGARNRKLPWSSLEFFLYALEDLVSSRMLADGDLSSNASDMKLGETDFSRGATMTNQSLKPYARSLSHELRTPMQGVVGMLDVMHATVQEEVEGQPDRHVKEVFRNLKENIELVQDSSRRAVEAADNVVHAYDLNMQVPETPKQPTSGVEGEPEQPKNDLDIQFSKGKRPSIVVEGHDLSIERPSKRKRNCAPSDWYYNQQAKHRAFETPDSSPSTEPVSPRSLGPKRAVRESVDIASDTDESLEDAAPVTAILPHFDGSEETSAATVGHSRLRELLHLIINESLGVGERPEAAIAADTDLGERIEVQSKDLRGDVKTKVIELTVDPSVPETLLVDERDLTKLVSCVFLNAVKFTESGKITVTAKLNPKARYIVVTITDTGPGIPQTFLPYLFKPFSREDDSLTRQKDGLGLGLLVAKGLARKIGGDLNCISSDTSGPNKGSVFEIRVPITPLDGNMSGPGTPIHRTPTPSSSDSRQSPDIEGFISLQEIPRSVPLQDIASSLTTPNRPRQRLSLPTTIGALSAVSPLMPERTRRPLFTNSRSRRNTLSPQQPIKKIDFDRRLAEKYPITFLVAEDNRINRKLLVNMLRKMGYTDIYEAFDGADAVRQMEVKRDKHIDVVLMDLWMPYMDGYEAARRILSMPKHTNDSGSKIVTILAVTADVTSEALERAAQAGMEGFMTKPYKLLDLERLILEFCARKTTSE